MRSRSSRSHLPLVVLLLGFFAAGVLVADRVVLTNGNILEGSARELPDGAIEIASALGTLTLPRSAVERIERASTVEDEVARTLAEMGEPTAEALYELALWSESQGASTLALRLHGDVLRLDPDHEGARRALGFIRYEERWVTIEELHQIRGEVRFRGEWMSREERARLLEIDAARQLAEADRQRERTQALQLRYELERLRQESPSPPAGGIPYHPFGYGGGNVIIVPPVIPVPVPAAPRQAPHTASRPQPAAPAARATPHSSSSSFGHRPARPHISGHNN